MSLNSMFRRLAKDLTDMGKEQEVAGPWTGAVPASTGLASVVRIPLPGSNNLAVEFRPRNFKGDSTFVIFIQDKLGKRTLRLDYGYDVKSKTVDYYWNQKGTFDTAIEPGGGTAVLGVVFAIGGGIAGCWGGEKLGAVVYDWGDAVFSPLPKASR